MNGWLRNNRKHLRHWGDFYRSRASDRVPTTPVRSRPGWPDQLEPRQHVLDVGSGNGRDSAYFAGQGHRVTALDGTQRARRLTRRLAAQQSVKVRPQELNLNDLFSTLTSGARFAHLKAPPQIYARFLLDAIESDARENFFRWAQMIQRRGGLTFLEFRTWQSTLRAKRVPLPLPHPAPSESRGRRNRAVRRQRGASRDGRRAGTVRERKPKNLPTRSEVDVIRTDRDQVRKRLGPLSLYKRVVALEKEVQESRRLNQRLSDVVDVITEILVPAADRDDERMRAALTHLEVAVQPPTPEESGG